MPADFTPEEEYFHGLLIEGSPYTLSQHISRILASGAHFQYVDGEVIEIIRPGKEEEIVWASGATYQPPIEEVAAKREETPAPPLEPLKEVEVSLAVVESEPVKETPKAPVEKAPSAPVKEKVVVAPPKPKAVVAEKAPAKIVKAPAEINKSLAEVKEN